jgi:hypothetical protein
VASDGPSCASPSRCLLHGGGPDCMGGRGRQPWAPTRACARRHKQPPRRSSDPFGSCRAGALSYRSKYAYAWRYYEVANPARATAQAATPAGATRGRGTHALRAPSSHGYGRCRPPPVVVCLVGVPVHVGVRCACGTSGECEKYLCRGQGRPATSE